MGSFTCQNPVLWKLLHHLPLHWCSLQTLAVHLCQVNTDLNTPCSLRHNHHFCTPVHWPIRLGDHLHFLHSLQLFRKAVAGVQSFLVWRTNGSASCCSLGFTLENFWVYTHSLDRVHSWDQTHSFNNWVSYNGSFLTLGNINLLFHFLLLLGSVLLWTGQRPLVGTGLDCWGISLLIGELLLSCLYVDSSNTLNSAPMSILNWVMQQ